MHRICLIGIGLAISFLGSAAYADGDPVKGAVVFRKCQSCHTVKEGQNRVGPSLFGIVGRPTASIEGFRYSKAMAAYGASGKVWDDATLAAYLPAPRDAVPGTSMAFAGLKKPEDIANLIAYLKNPAAAQ
jgi:cytochrome c